MSERLKPVSSENVQGGVHIVGLRRIHSNGSSRRRDEPHPAWGPDLRSIRREMYSAGRNNWVGAERRGMVVDGRKGEARVMGAEYYFLGSPLDRLFSCSSTALSL